MRVKQMKKFLTLLMLTIMLLGLAGCGGNTESKAEQRDAYPADGKITVLIPKAQGGGTDTSARDMLYFMKKELQGSKFVPVNRPEGNGITAMAELAKSKPDGHTLGMVTVELSMIPHQGKASVSHKDFVSICATTVAPAALIVSGEFPVWSLDEFVRYAKANPGKIRVGNSGTGSIWHLAALNFEKEFGVIFKHVPYPKGVADIAVAMEGKHIDAALADPAAFRGRLDSGAVKMLAVTTNVRLQAYPKIPTFRELGHPMTIRAWAVLAAPKDTPKERVEILRKAAAKICGSKEYKELLRKQGDVPVSIIGDDCDRMMAEDTAFYGKLLTNNQKQDRTANK